MRELVILLTLVLTSQLGYGLTELERLANDRPQLLTMIHPGDEIWTWLDARFSDTLGCKVHWDTSGRMLKTCCKALSMSGWEDSLHPVLEIASRDPFSGKPMTGSQILIPLIFELLNLEHRDERSKLMELAAKREINEDVFVKQRVMSEYKVFLKLKIVSKTIIEPFLKKHNQPIPLELQQDLSIPDDPDVYWNRRVENPGDYLAFYRRQYEASTRYPITRYPKIPATPVPTANDFI